MVDALQFEKLDTIDAVIRQRCTEITDIFTMRLPPSVTEEATRGIWQDRGVYPPADERLRGRGLGSWDHHARCAQRGLAGLAGLGGRVLQRRGSRGDGRNTSKPDLFDKASAPHLTADGVSQGRHPVLVLDESEGIRPALLAGAVVDHAVEAGVDSASARPSTCTSTSSSSTASTTSARTEPCGSARLRRRPKTSKPSSSGSA